jgi:hypothetical protein
MPEIRMVDMKDGVAEYEMIEVEDGEESSYYIEFMQDFDGTWKISFF